MEQKGKNILGIVSDILLVLIIIVAIIITVLTFTSKSSEAGVGNILGYTPFSVTTDSMSPTINKGDIIITKEVADPKNELKVGDVITFRSLMKDDAGNQVLGFNTHRIVEIKHSDANGQFEGYITKGDGALSEDAQVVYPGDIVGKQVNATRDENGEPVKGLTLRGFGKVIDFLSGRFGFMICIIIPLALFFIWQVYKLITMFMTVKGEEISEESKQQVIEEYLAKQKAMTNGESDNKSSDDSQDDK